MAHELRTLVDAIQDTDAYSNSVLKDLTDENEILKKTIRTITKSLKQQKTWHTKLSLHNRRLKHALKNKEKTIDKLKTENAETSTWNGELLTKNIVLTMDNERNTDDFKTLKARLDDHSCPYCGAPAPRTSSTGAPAPRTSSTGTQTPVTFNKHFMG